MNIHIYIYMPFFPLQAISRVVQKLIPEKALLEPRRRCLP